MNSEVFETVLNEVLEEIKSSGKSSAEQATLISQLINVVRGFEQKLGNVRVLPAPVDTASLQKIVTDGFAGNKSVVDEGIQEITGIVQKVPKMVKEETLYEYSEYIVVKFKGALDGLYGLMIILIILVAIHLFR